MPIKPPRPCPRCQRLRQAGQVCRNCGYSDTSGWKNSRKPGTRQQRGYDETWLKLRRRKLHANPLCEQCEKEGRLTVATTVDHVEPFEGRSDPKRLDWDNLQSLCERCHARKSARQGRR